MRISETAKRRLLQLGGATAIAGIALTIRRWIFNTVAVDPIHWQIRPAAPPVGISWFLLAAAVAVIAVAVCGKADKLGRKLLPALLFVPLLLLPPEMPVLLATLAVCSWCAYRALNGRCRCVLTLPRDWHTWAVAALALAAGAWSFVIQKRAFDTMFLAYQDWGEYTECYLKLAFGAESLKAFLARAGHFNLLPNLLMSAALYLVTVPETVFAASALLLASLPLLTWKLAREYRLPDGCALGFAAIAAFDPIFINQSLSLFYGFHPVLFQGPLILLFLLMERRKCRWGMIAAVIASLCVQETAAVLWFGYGIYLLTRKKYSAGLLLAAGCPLFFLLISHAVMPWVFEAVGNPQTFHYAQLGGSPMEIMLSPLLRPRAFFGTLCQMQNLYFLTALLLPLGGALSRRPLIIGAPMLLGVLLQESPLIKNPAMQYGFELSVLLVGCAVTDFRGAKRDIRRGAALRSAVFMTLLCAFFYARIPYGKYPAAVLFRMPKANATIGYLRKFSTGDTRVLTTKRLRLYHMFDRATAPLDGEWRVNDTIVLDLDDAMEDVGEARRRLLETPQAMPITSTNFYGSTFTVWKIAPPGVPRAPLPFMMRTTPQEFAALGGRPLDSSDANFSLRLRQTAGRGTRLMIRLDRKIAYDVDVELRFESGGQPIHRRHPFGEGIRPAWAADPGETYVLDIKEAEPDRLSVVLAPRLKK